LILGLTPEQVVIALAAAGVAAFVRGLAGFGMAILLVPVLGLAVAPAQAVVISNLLGALIGLPELRGLAQGSESSAKPVAVLAVLATPLGMAVLALTPPDIARLLIALVAVTAFLAVLLPPCAVRQPGWQLTGAIGLSAGFLTGFAAMPGVTVAPFYLGRRISPALARSSMLLVFFAVSVAGCLSALILGLAEWNDLWLALLLLPGVVLGNGLGARAFGRIAPQTWRWIAALVLGVGAAGAVIRLL
jgi:uncharacterized protein